MSPTRYRTIVADPPWEPVDYRQRTGVSFTSQERREGFTVRRLAYPTMSVDEIAALPVSAIADRDAHLYIWTTQAHLRFTFGIAETWGFQPVVTLVWCKPLRGWGMGGTFQSNVEFVVFARRGTVRAPRNAAGQWFEWPRGQHSAKPEAFVDIVERVSPGPYVELFARRARFGWDYWGDESLGTASLSPIPERGAA